MIEEQIRQLLQSRTPSGAQPGFRCPGEHTLAAYVNGKFSGKERADFEKHAASCNACLDAISFLTQSEEWSETADLVPPYLLARAQALVKEKPAPVWRWRWALATGAAACIVLALTFVILRSRVQQTPVREDAGLIAQNQPTRETVQVTPTIEANKVSKPKIGGEAPSVRGSGGSRASEGQSIPVLLSPREGSVVRRGDLQLHWQPVADAVSYEVRLTARDGTPVLTKETKDSKLQFPVLELQSDTRYYLKVVAQMSDGRAVQSDIVSFRVGRD